MEQPHLSPYISLPTKSLLTEIPEASGTAQELGKLYPVGKQAERAGFRLSIQDSVFWGRSRSSVYNFLFHQIGMIQPMCIGLS